MIAVQKYQNNWFFEMYWNKTSYIIEYTVQHSLGFSHNHNNACIDGPIIWDDIKIIAQ